MTYRQFIVPGDDEFLDTFGIEPVVDGDEPTIRIVSLDADSGEDVHLSYNVTGRSVRLRWSKGGQVLGDVFREGATHLTVDSTKSEISISVEFETEGLAGGLRIQLTPFFLFEDKLLFK